MTEGRGLIIAPHYPFTFHFHPNMAGLCNEASVAVQKSAPQAINGVRTPLPNLIVSRLVFPGHGQIFRRRKIFSKRRKTFPLFIKWYQNHSLVYSHNPVTPFQVRFDPALLVRR
jgi:hypothetical protein